MVVLCLHPISCQSSYQYRLTLHWYSFGRLSKDKDYPLKPFYQSTVKTFINKLSNLRVGSGSYNLPVDGTVKVVILARLNVGDSPVLDELVRFYFHGAEFTPIDLCTKETYWRIFILAFIKS